MTKLEKCPVTGSNLEQQFECVDYLVSKESFMLNSNADASILITSPRPNDNDLGKYYESEDYISHTDSSKSIFDRAYQTVRNIALNNKLKLINQLADEKNLLDYGCGTGDFLHHAQQNDWTVSGIEPSTDAKSIAQSKVGIDIGEPADLFKFKTESFDIITLWHVLEHVPNLIEVSEQLSKLLKPGGHLILALPNFKSYDALLLGREWAAYDVPRHLWHFSKKGVEQLSDQIGLKYKDSRPMPFDSFYVSMLSNKQSKGKMKPLQSFLLGLKSNLKARKTNEWSSLIHILEKGK